MDSEPRRVEFLHVDSGGGLGGHGSRLSDSLSTLGRGFSEAFSYI